MSFPSKPPGSVRASRALLLALLLALGSAIAQAAGAPAFPIPLYPEFRYSFALIGDVPYNDRQETNEFPNVIAELNRDRHLAFVVHDGDIKAGATPCSEELLERRFQQFQQIQHPLVYIFGDNEWSDCAKAAGQRSPEQWLERLRERFCAGDRSLGGRTIHLDRQSRRPAFTPFRENVRWIHGGAVFAGLNVPGDANNFGQPEFKARNAANIAWIHETFDLAERHRLGALMLILQANPHFDLPATNRVRLGFNEMLTAIEERTIRFGHPVVLVHGDSHYFRIDQPLLGRRSGRRVENFTRVETYGNPDVHWIKATVDWRTPEVFVFERKLVRKNFVRH